MQFLHPVYELHEPHVETPLPEEHVADAGLMHCAEEGHQLQAPPLGLPPEMQLLHPVYELQEPHVETGLPEEHVPDDEVSIHWEEDGHHWQLLLPEESLVEVQVLHPVIVLQGKGHVSNP